jgi:hypothetical protein
MLAATTVCMRERMGHASIQISVDVCGHLVPGGHRAEVDHLDDSAVVQPLYNSALPRLRQSA